MPKPRRFSVKEYDGLLTVQDKVTSQLISELQLSLSPSEAERLKPENPVNPLAYEYFLQGLDFHGQHKFPLAIKMPEKSTGIDPNYAAAWPTWELRTIRMHHLSLEGWRRLANG